MKMVRVEHFVMLFVTDDQPCADVTTSLTTHDPNIKLLPYQFCRSNTHDLLQGKTPRITVTGLHLTG